MSATSLDEKRAVHTATVESIATGGSGVARLDERVVFIPRTAPGDFVRFRVQADKGNYLLGEAAEVVDAGPDRREPPCAHWTTCGGCPIQQLHPHAQRSAKERILNDALSRIGKVDLGVPVQHVATDADEFGYRLRARFQIQGERIGFFAPKTRKLAAIEGCLLAEPPIAKALSAIGGLLKTSSDAQKVESVEITSLGHSPDEGAGLLLYPLGSRDRGGGTFSRKARRAWEGFSRANNFPLGYSGARSPEDPPAWQASYLPDPQMPSLVLRVSPESFIQPNRAGNQALVRTVLDKARLTPDSPVVDLYCGAGNFSLPLARHARRVLGVESNPFALYDAEANRIQNRFENVRFILRESGRIEASEIRDALMCERPDLLLLDPPRRGALEAMPLISALAPRRIVYVSCNPATFARDAREIASAGYRAEAICQIPMFPNTAHVETLTSWRHENTPEE